MMLHEDKFILNGKVPEACADLMRWGRWIQTADRIVARTEVGALSVSTVFLGMNHNFIDGPPLLFETMVFRPAAKSEQSNFIIRKISKVEVGGDVDLTRRYSTWDEAEAGHAKIVALLVAAKPVIGLGAPDADARNVDEQE